MAVVVFSDMAVPLLSVPRWPAMVRLYRLPKGPCSTRGTVRHTDGRQGPLMRTRAVAPGKVEVTLKAWPQ
ncbi:predicted protein [Streptomyces viridosporus ATCC 14672]|uniref:Predicted protein n=1 Tax=Streptomyces viridosporus (strain ATCC 14672 / DSM 40746 / JCM 4963 / KCTC 9882 / NRRL B-12104 / FH 1290) TaxID=566461 RepID=D6A153_STRV1|nr:predicted protein [Streptomyces viridosporus ATCC 14672]